VIARIVSRYEGRWLRGYVRGKLRHDPIYAAGLELLKDSPRPVLDVGCGIGLLACWLRALPRAQLHWRGAPALDCYAFQQLPLRLPLRSMKPAPGVREQEKGNE
jgi:hypothetical protein